jgi:glycosyltransferase involved in cell wall biosynthesis
MNYEQYRLTKPLRLLCMFDYGPHTMTGFATVSKNIIYWIKKIMGPQLYLDICAVNCFEDMYDEDEQTTVFSATRCAPKEHRDDYGRKGFYYLLDQSTEYDGIFMMVDIGIVTPMVPVFQWIKNKKKQENVRDFKSMLYFPIDCKTHRFMIEGLEFFDTLVTYTDFGRKEVLNCHPEMKPSRIKAIPHGVNTGHFFPIPQDERMAFRKEFFGEHADKFIVTNVNRNQHRKDVVQTILGFEKFHEQYPNSLLYLHMHPHDPLGTDLGAIIWQTNLEVGKNVMFTPKSEIIEKNNQDIEVKKEVYQTDVHTLNKIYNACDVYVTTTRGEGWGLSVTEAMACKLPVICPDNTSLSEISGYGERAYMLEEYNLTASDRDNIIRPMCNDLEVAEVLEKVKIAIDSGDKKHQDKITKAYEYATSLQWKGIAEKWVELFYETYKPNNKPIRIEGEINATDVLEHARQNVSNK